MSDDDKIRLGNVVLEQIRDRTRSGVGVTPEGREYNLQSKPYTREYAREKGSSKVDLTLSGNMLENMHVSGVSGNKVKITVAPQDRGKLEGAEDGILRNKRGPGGKRLKTKELIKRPFFHLSSKDKESIVNDPEFQRTLKRAINRELKKLED